MKDGSGSMFNRCQMTLNDTSSQIKTLEKHKRRIHRSFSFRHSGLLICRYTM